MRKEKYAPTIAHDLRALADLYAAVAVLMARRLTHRTVRPRPSHYGPFEVIRPRAMNKSERG